MNEKIVQKYTSLVNSLRKYTNNLTNTQTLVISLANVIAANSDLVASNIEYYNKILKQIELSNNNSIESIRTILLDLSTELSKVNKQEKLKQNTEVQQESVTEEIPNKKVINPAKKQENPTETDEIKLTEENLFGDEDE